MRVRVSLLLCLFTGAVWAGPFDTQWRSVADSDIRFARQLSEGGVLYRREFVDVLIMDNVVRCQVRPSRISRLSPLQLRLIRSYGENHCEPWNSLWVEILEPCEGGLFVPKWCKAGNEDLAALHIGFEAYVEPVLSALRSVADGLQRLNLLVILSERLESRPMRDYPREERREWMERGLSTFLEEAEPRHALGAAWVLHRRSLSGNDPAQGRLLEDYASTPSVSSTPEAGMIRALAAVFRPGEFLADDQKAEIEAFAFRGRELPEVEVPEIDVGESEIALLVSRVNEYYSLIRRRQFGRAWELVDPEFREVGYEREPFVKTRKRFYPGSLKNFAWTILGIEAHSNVARVELETRWDERKWLFWREHKENRSSDFWVLRGETWFNMIRSPEDWPDEGGRRIAVPGSDSASAP